MLTIALPTDTAFYALRVELEGVTFNLDLSWNDRAGTWYLSISSEDGTLLAAGMALVSNWRLLERYKHIAGMPAGDLMAADPTATIDAPDYEQLGTSVQLVYFTAAEIAEAEAE